MNLELEFDKAAVEAGIAPYTWTRYKLTLATLRDHHVGMWQHSLRVGLYSYGIAVAEGWPDTAMPLMGGGGHDVGKRLVPCSVLDATGEFGELHRTIIRRHPEDGRIIWMPEFPVTGMIAGLHHYFTPSPYGVSMEFAPEWLPARLAHRVIEATMVVMISDVFDAATTRRNAQTQCDPDDTEAVRQMMGQQFGDWPSRVEWLAANRIS